MIVRPVTLDDFEIIKKLNEEHKDFKLSHFHNPIIDRIVFSKGKPVAYGLVKRMAEAIMLVDSEAPLSTRAKAMMELMQYAEYGAKAEGCDQLHCFVSSPKLANALTKHYGFIPSADIVLVKNL